MTPRVILHVRPATFPDPIFAGFPAVARFSLYLLHNRPPRYRQAFREGSRVSSKLPCTPVQFGVARSLGRVGKLRPPADGGSINQCAHLGAGALRWFSHRTRAGGQQSRRLTKQFLRPSGISPFRRPSAAYLKPFIAPCSCIHLSFPSAPDRGLQLVSCGPTKYHPIRADRID